MSSVAPGRPGFPLPPVESATLTVSDLARLFFAHALRGLAESTCNGYRQYLKAFCVRFGHTLVAELKMFDVFAWIGQQPGWKSDSTFATVHKSINRLFNWGVRFQLIERNPVVGLPVPRDTQRRNWKDRELIRIVRNSTPAFRRYVYFMAWTGARPGETRELQWSDIDWQRNCVVLGKHKTSNTTRERKPRTIILIPVAVRLLRWIERLRKYHRIVFLNDHERPWTTGNVCRRIERIRSRLGLSKDIKTYGLRHLFGTNAVRRGLDIKTLSLLMGHESIRMTERYIHLAGDTTHLLDAAIKATGKTR